jgi:hypothetical protein
VSPEITFAQRDAAAEFRKAERRRTQAIEHMRNPGAATSDAEAAAVLGFLVADSVYEEKKAEAIRAFAPVMP